MEKIILEKIRYLVKKNNITIDQPIELDSTLYGIGLDSLDLAELMLDFEESFNITIDEGFDGEKTVRLFVEYIDSKVPDDL